MASISSPHPPSALPASVVVVGAGLAGARTVAELRSHGFAGRITVLGAEGVPPYDRPPLSKELLTRPEPAWLSAELGIDLTALADEVRWSDPVVALDRDDPAGPLTTTTASGDRLHGDAVILAVGAEPVRPVGWDSALTLHTEADAARLRAAIGPGTRLAIIGAGWIGAEVAGVATAAGARVTVIEGQAVPLQRQLGRDVGAHLARWYGDAGVHLRTGTGVVGVSPDVVHLSDGEELAADVVLAAVGARPATGWLARPLGLRTAAIPVDSAGRVLAGRRPGRAGTPNSHTEDEHAGRRPGPAGTPAEAIGARSTGARPPASGRTNPGRPLTGDPATGLIPGLWAVGDCATREDPVFGRVPGGHWSAALHDPEPTARALLGIDQRASEPESARVGLAPVPRHAPYVFSQQLGHDIALFGTPDPAHAVVFRGDPTGGATGHGGWTALYVAPTSAGPRGVAAMRAVLVVDAPREVGAVRRLMNRGVPLRLDLAVATDPGHGLRDAVV